MSNKNNTKYGNALLLVVLIVSITGIALVTLKIRSLRPVTLIVPRGTVVTVNDYTLDPKKQPIGTDLKKQTYLIRLPIGANLVSVATEDRDDKSYEILVKEEDENPLFILIDADFRDRSQRQSTETNP